jgi:hypothetical protein
VSATHLLHRSITSSPSRDLDLLARHQAWGLHHPVHAVSALFWSLVEAVGLRRLQPGVPPCPHHQVPIRLKTHTARPRGGGARGCLVQSRSEVARGLGPWRAMNNIREVLIWKLKLGTWRHGLAGYRDLGLGQGLPLLGIILVRSQQGPGERQEAQGHPSRAALRSASSSS